MINRYYELRQAHVPRGNWRLTLYTYFDECGNHPTSVAEGNFRDLYNWVKEHDYTVLVCGGDYLVT